MHGFHRFSLVVFTTTVLQIGLLASYSNAQTVALKPRSQQGDAVDRPVSRRDRLYAEIQADYDIFRQHADLLKKVVRLAKPRVPQVRRRGR